MSNHIVISPEYKIEPAYLQLREVHNLETYDDYAGILKKMSHAVVEMLEMSVGERDEFDPVEKQNLETLANLLPICSDLFINCDPYYRRYPKR